MSSLSQQLSLAIDEIKSEVKRIIPPLNDENYKGRCGKIAVVGGCMEYTGQPYFCAMAALKTGADLSHVFCTWSAAPIIKGYSPDLLVHPYLKETADFKPGELTPELRACVVRDLAAEVESWFTRLDCLVVGPGLGRDPLMLDVARDVILRARRASLPLVLDGDALLLVAREPLLVQGYSLCLLTPNLNEFRRLSSTMGISQHGSNTDRVNRIIEVVLQLQGPLLVSKGPVDVISDGKSTVVCGASAGNRRCGSQGDILAGVMAVFIAWHRSFLVEVDKSDDVVLPCVKNMVLAAFGACSVTRTACVCAFAAKRRSMLASDILEQLGTALEMLESSTGGGELGLITS